MSDRTIEATPQRRRQARLEGRFPRSRELTICALSLLALSALHFRGQLWFQGTGDLLITHLSAPPQLSIDTGSVKSLTIEPLARALAVLFPVLVVGLVAVVGIQLTQGGFVWLPHRVAPDVSRIVPGHSTQVLTTDRTIRSLFALLKMIVGLAVMLGGIWCYREQLVGAQQGSLFEGAMLVAVAVAHVALAVVAVVTALSIAEYAARLSSYYRSLRMSAQELRDENRGRSTIRIESPMPAGDDGPQRRPAQLDPTSSAQVHSPPETAVRSSEYPNSSMYF